MVRLTNNTGIVAPVFEEMAKMYGSHPKMGNDHFSATELNKSIKDVVMSRTVDETIDSDIQYHLKTIRGTWFHEAMENRLKYREDCKCENRFSMDIDVETDIGTRTVKFSGGVDCIWERPDGELVILDYKNSTQAKIDKETNGVDESWKRQMYAYATLIEQNLHKRPVSAVLVCFDDSKRSGDIDITDPTTCIAQQIEIDLSDREYEGALFEDYKRRLSVIVGCLELGYKAPDCTKEETWMTETRYGVKKWENEGMWRSYQSLEEAVNVIAGMKAKDKSVYRIYTLPGKPKKCSRFCDYYSHCSQGQELVRAYEESATTATVYNHDGTEHKEEKDGKTTD